MYWSHAVCSPLVIVSFDHMTFVTDFWGPVERLVCVGHLVGELGQSEEW